MMAIIASAAVCFLIFTTHCTSSSVSEPTAPVSQPSSVSEITIHTETAMRLKDGTVVTDCLMPHIAKFNATWYAYGFGIPRNDTGDERFPTCYTSPDLAVWTKQQCSTPSVQVPLWNEKNREYVAIGQNYGRSFTSYTSSSPLGPFIKRQAMTPVFGGAGDSTTFVDSDGAAYLIYNRYTGPIPQRFTYIYRLNDDYTDILSETLSNTTHVMEGLWMLKRFNTYYLLGSPLVVYDDADDFYLTAPTPLGAWTYKGLVAPAGSRTFDSQVFRGLQVPSSTGISAVVIATRWCNPYPKYTPPPPAVCPPTCVCHPPFRNTTSIWLPLHFDANGSILILDWVSQWNLSIG
eukprot:m.471434 g.471434  ORF g.471434 m.471434 type:complete len:347 (+) comp31062_c0_seq1:1527-2567(+)